MANCVKGRAPRRRVAVITQAALLVAGFSSSAPGATFAASYIGAATGTYEVAGNWSGGVIPDTGNPTAADFWNVTINRAGGGTVNTTSDLEVLNLTIGASNRLRVGDGFFFTAIGTAAQGTCTITNNGTIDLLSTGGFPDARLRLLGSFTNLSGSGVIELDNAAQILGDGGTLITSNTIRGSGTVGTGTLAITNNGTFLASNSGEILQVQPQNATGFINQGLLSALAGATLRLAGGTFNNASGSMTVLSGATLELSASPFISGGLIDGIGSGGVVVPSGTATLSGVNLTANTRIAPTATLALTNTNLGDPTTTLFVGTSVGNATLNLSGAATLNGGGLLLGQGTGSFGVIHANAAGATLRNVGGTILGQGTIGSGGTLTVINSGNITAFGGPLFMRLSGGTLQNTGGTVTIATDATLRFPTSSIINSGTIFINGGTLALDAGTLTLNGGGILTTAGSSTISGAGTFVNVNKTLRIGGFLRAPGTAIINQGTITSSTAIGDLIPLSGSVVHNSGTIVNNGSIPLRVYSPVVNSGTMMAAGGSLIFGVDSGSGSFSGGTISAGTASLVSLTTGVRVHNATITTSGTGLIQVPGLNQATISNISSSANFGVGDFGELTIVDSTLGGPSTTIDLGQGGSGRMLVSGVGTISGGTVLLGGVAPSAAGNLNAATLGGTLHNLGATIRGHGNITGLAGGSMVFNNAGTVECNVNVLALGGASDTFNNSGLIRAAGTGLTVFLGGTTINNTGTIAAAGDSHVSFDDLTFVGGTISVAATSSVDFDTSATGTFANVNISNNGLIRIGAVLLSPATAVLNSTTLSGSGSVVLQGSAGINVLGNSGSIINQSNTIRGAGTFTARVTNSGTFGAFTSGDNLRLFGPASFTNNGTIAATAGTVRLGPRVYNGIGTITASGTGTIGWDSGVTFSGQTLVQSGAGTMGITISGGGATFSGVTSNADLDFTNRTLRLGSSTTFTNNGTVNLLSDTAAASLLLSAGGTATLAGTGRVIMGTTDPTMFGTAIAASGGSATLVNSSTIEGEGSLGFNTLRLFNSGTIMWNGNTRNLTIDAIGTLPNLTNTGHIIAAGTLAGGALEIPISNNSFQNTGGTISVSAGSRLLFPTGGTVTGGTILLNGGTLATDSGTVSLNGAGTLATGAGALSWFAGSGTIVNVDKTFHLGGNLAVTTAAFINQGTITNAAASQVLLASSFINQGTIVTSGGSLTLQGNITNTGRMIASGGTMNLAGVTYTNTGGTMSAASGSVVRLVSSSPTIIGGHLTGAGSFHLVSSVATLQAATITSGTFFRVADGAILGLRGTINNLGAISSFNPSIIDVGSGTVFLNGTGTLSCGGIGGALQLIGSGTLISQNNLSLADVGLDIDCAAFINQGTITGGDSWSNLNTGSSLFINNSYIRVPNFSTFAVASPIQNAGTIALTNATGTTGFGGSLMFLRSTISGGTLSNLGGKIRVTFADGTLSNLIFHNLNSGSTVASVEVGNRTLNVNCAILNDGSITVGSGTLLSGAGTILVDGGLTSLAGSGSLALANRFSMLAGNGSLSNGAAHLIAGEGTIAMSGLVNAGTIAANVSLSGLRLSPGPGGLTNTGTLLATNNTALILGGGSVGAATVNNVGGRIISTDTSAVLFDNALVNGGTFSGFGSIVFNAQATLSDLVSSGLITAEGTLNFAGTVTNTSVGELEIAGFSAGPSAVMHSDGILRVSSGGAMSIGSISGNGTILVNAITGSNATLAARSISARRLRVEAFFPFSPAVAQVTLGAGTTNATTSRLESLVIDGNGRLDLTRGSLFVDYTSVSAFADVEADIISGRAGGAWDGFGIVSSLAAGSPGTAVGLAEAVELFSVFPATFAGELVDNTAVLMRYTLLGDADLDGAVSLNDFTRLASAFGTSSRWSSGDFDYDGQTNLADFTALAANFGQALPAGRSGIAIPEPTSALTAMLISSLPAFTRRPRRRRSDL